MIGLYEVLRGTIIGVIETASLALLAGIIALPIIVAIAPWCADCPAMRGIYHQFYE